MKPRHAALLLFFLPLTISPRANEVSQVAMSASATTVTIGEHVELRVVARVAAGVSAMRVQVKPGAFEVITRQALKKEGAAGGTLEEVITIAFFQTGDFEVGPFPIRLLPERDGGEAETGQVAIRVRSLLEESDKDIKPLKEPLSMAGDPRFLLPYAAALLLLLLLAALALLLRKRAQGRHVRATVPPLPPEIEFQESLLHLRQEGLLQRGEYRTFFIALSALLKRFIQRAYGFNAEDCTTAETVPRLRERETEAAIITGLEAVLTQADLVKFARQIPGDEEVATLWPILDSIIAGHRARRQQAQEADHVQAGR